MKDLYTNDLPQINQILSFLQKFDLDGDGAVCFEDFLTVCRKDKDIQQSLKAVDSLEM